jgi:hypothetical protein
MMRIPPAIRRAAARLSLSFGMAALLLLALAYWWLGNQTHEIAGVTVTLLMLLHSFQNRAAILSAIRWKKSGLRWLFLTLHVSLASNLLLLIGSGWLISQEFANLRPDPAGGRFYELHWFAAYWLVINLGLHFGVHWQRVIMLCRTGLRIRAQSFTRRVVSQVLAVCIAIFGAYSWFELDFVGKLIGRRSLQFWDFSASVLPFFLHWISVAAIPAICIYCVLSHSLTARPKRNDGAFP